MDSDFKKLSFLYGDQFDDIQPPKEDPPSPLSFHSLIQFCPKKSKKKKTNIIILEALNEHLSDGTTNKTFFKTNILR